MIDLENALSFIDPASCTYEEWLEIGMGLKSAFQDGDAVSWEVWDRWSATDPNRYQPGVCELKWNSFNSTGITKGTIIKRAMDNGFDPINSADGVMDWVDEIQTDAVPEQHDPDFKRFINALFKPDDLVSYCLKSKQNENGKWQPSAVGVLGRKAKDIIRDFEHYNGNIREALGDYNSDAGGWIRFNPVDGQGVKSENVTDYRYALVESDEGDPLMQLKKIYELALPCKAIIHSGGKSIHAIVHIGAKTEEEYRERVRFLFQTLTDQGFNVDTANKNPNRMTRMPGLKRGNNYQKLLQLNSGYKSFSAWKEFVENGLEEIELPEIEELTAVWDNMPDLAPELIGGVLRQGHKMLIAAPSKAGKSFSLIELAIAIAEGKTWFGFECRMGKVLYINLEIDSASFFHRIKSVYEAMGIEPNHLENLDVWNLRGKALPMQKLTPKLIRRVRDKGYTAIILDPVYKVQGGDENSAGDIARFTNEFDTIARELGTSMIYCHHHSKGQQGAKKSLDRASGSGVFSRDPDAIIDLIELANDTYKEVEDYADLTAWRVEGTLREFPPFTPKNIFFDYPVHVVDDVGILDLAEVKTDYAPSKIKRQRLTPKERLTNRLMDLELAFDVVSENGTVADELDLMNYFEISSETLRKRIQEYNVNRGEILKRKNGQVLKTQTNWPRWENGGGKKTH